MGVMAISFDVGEVSLETTVGVGQGSIESAMMGPCLCRVDWSDQINHCNLRIQLGLARSSISKSKGSSKMDLKALGLDMLLDGSAMRLFE